MERRLSAILAADMVGYSRLMEADEIGVLKRQKVLRSELIDPAFTEFRGRIVKEMGDGVLVEFPSVVQAVQCAVVIQRAMVVRGESDLPDQRIQYRIGINLGDIVIENDDIFGDGVNIAARLEQLAEPGGVCISGTAYDHLKSTVDVGYEALGDVQVKNIGAPVRAYRVLTDPDQAGNVLGKTKSRSAPPIRSVASALILLIIGAGSWWWINQPDFSPVDPTQMALELPQKPSIAVLPFEMRGNAGSQDWLADGITESIISTLSLSPDMVSIAYSTMSSFKDRDVSAAQVARKLGVRYILSGSVLKVGDKLRVTSELADAVKGKQIWSIQQDSSPDDLIVLQDEISHKVFEELSVSLTVGEGTRSWIEMVGGFNNYVQVINGRAEFQKFSPEGHANAERLWGKLYRMEPNRAFANFLMGFIYWQKVTIGISADIPGDWAKATEFSNRALEIEEFGEGYTLGAVLAQGARKFEEAIKLADKAILLSPGSADSNALGGMVKAMSGQTLEGLEHMERGMRLEPDYPEWLPAPINFARLELGRNTEARKLAQEVLATDIQDVRAKPNAAGILVAAAVFDGDMNEARARALDLQKIYPGITGAFARMARSTYKNQAFVEKYVNALVQAGIPEN
ncbi:adenylate/guanylate cyclase domain-containing protein [Pseudahrensia aquimaris]|uniref:Adenylate/guanylate cyclase domain-containing protein n=1 Tax=Pseudahrensia aquimaris TaxID=744461 RepID=A0ABW3FGV6_9HYPH